MSTLGEAPYKGSYTHGRSVGRGDTHLKALLMTYNGSVGERGGKITNEFHIWVIAEDYAVFDTCA